MSNEAQQDVCRDYLNKICTRGRKCRYFHPPRVDDFTEDSCGRSFSNVSDTDLEIDFSFCLDFQSNPRGCDRTTCRYLHCSKESAEEYQHTGKIDLELARSIAAANPNITEIAGRQLCKEFKYQRCARDLACKFWHIQPLFEQERRFGLHKSCASIPPEEPPSYSHPPDSNYDYPPKRNYRDDRFKIHGDYGRPSARKRARDEPEIPLNGQSLYSTQNYRSESQFSLLLTENSQLKTTYDTLLQTVNSLKASNTQLLEENASLRAAVAMSNEAVGVTSRHADKGSDLDASLSIFPRLR